MIYVFNHVFIMVMVLDAVMALVSCPTKKTKRYVIIINDSSTVTLSLPRPLSLPVSQTPRQNIGTIYKHTTLTNAHTHTLTIGNTLLTSVSFSIFVFCSCSFICVLVRARYSLFTGFSFISHIHKNQFVTINSGSSLETKKKMETNMHDKKHYFRVLSTQQAYWSVLDLVTHSLAQW